jgi:hypothetical protein
MSASRPWRTLPEKTRRRKQSRRGGTLTTTFNGDESAGALLVQPDGKIVAAGFSEDNSTGRIFIALARYNG